MDNNYISYLAINIINILEYNKNVDFYILNNGVDKFNRDALYNITNNIYFIDVNDFKELPLQSRIPIIAYARINIAEYIRDCNKIIYLDVGTLILGSLVELWNIDLGNKWVVACIDSYIEYECQNYKQSIGITKEQLYFNAGMLLINLEKWRSFIKESFNFLSKHPNIKYQDKDILNYILKDKVKYLDARYNFMPTIQNKIKKYKKITYVFMI